MSRPLALLALLLLSPPLAAEAPLTAVPFPSVAVQDAFWGPRLATNRKVTVEANLRQCEVTHRIHNFAVAAKKVEGKHAGLLFNDSDVYKAIEGIAYTLTLQRDSTLERRADAIIDLIAAAQQPDGYLNTYYTLARPKERWRNIQFGHELYCAGHLIEAAVAYHQATGKRKLLDVAIKFADHIDRVFGPGKRYETCGHEEIELALVKLHHATREKKYLDLAKFFLDVRGTTGPKGKTQRKLFGEYAQDHKPIRQQHEVCGHAVRAMYLYCGMADVAGLTDDKTLWEALEHIWRDVTQRKMYLTGGIGPSAHNEGFTVPYDLPNDSAYAETCAAIGMALWNHRMFLRTGDGRYVDILEREVYNGLLSGVSLSGDRFFYTNPLASTGRHQRVGWFDCPCCPTNVVRYLPGMGERVWAHRGDAVWSVLYLGSTATVPLKDASVRLVQKTRYPWEGRVTISVELLDRDKKPTARTFDLHLRIPGWCKDGWAVKVNGTRQDLKAEKGYIRLSRTWKSGDVVELDLPMPVERVHAHPKVKANAGRVALQRGPVVYCLEGADNGGKVRNLALPRDARLSSAFRKDLLGGVVAVTGSALSVSAGEDDKIQTKPVSFVAIPYHAWANRKPGEMIVWLAEKPEVAELPGQAGSVRVRGVRIRASHLNPTDTLEELNDGKTPKSSGDHNIRRMTWWDHLGTKEWLSYTFGKEQTVSSAAVYWFDDTGGGRCRVPAEWQLLYKAGKEHRPVKLKAGSSYGVAKDQFNTIYFEPMKTSELRLEVKLRKGFSGGVLRWAVPAAK
jgi:DUF1680 family protein